MRIIFCLFPEIDYAKKAIETLLQAGLKEEEMNCIVQEAMAKEYLKIQSNELSYQKGTEQEKLRGLKRLFGGQQPVNVSDTGRIYVAGTVATTMVGAAVEQPEKGLESVLKEFGLSAEIARKYIDGLSEGALLFWSRTDENKSGDVILIMERFLASDITTVSPGPPTR